jgi:hypothetical protein
MTTTRQALTSSLNTYQLNLGIGDKRMKYPDCV